MNDTSTDLRHLLERKYAMAQSGDLAGLLGVKADSTDEQVRSRYLYYAKLFHPDALGRSELADMGSEASLVFDKLTEASSVLGTADPRKEWFESRDGGGEADEEPAGGGKSSIVLHEVRRAMKHRKWELAEGMLAEYCESFPKDPEGFVLHGLAIYRNDSYDRDTRLARARKSWERALEIDWNFADAHYHLALYWRDMGDGRQVGWSLEKALKHEPAHAGAQRLQRLIEMRGGGGSAKGDSFTAKASLFFKRLVGR